MNILFIYEKNIVCSQGGVERVTFILSEEFKKRGHNVSFLSIEEEQPEEASVDFYQYSRAFDSSEDYRRWFLKVLKDTETDIVIFQGTCPELRVLMTLVPKPVKKVVVFHNQPYSVLYKEKMVKKNTPFSSLRPKGKMLKCLAIVAPGVYRKLFLKSRSADMVRILENVDKFILLSSKFEDRFLNNTPGDIEEKIVSINNPITFIPESLGEKSKEDVVLFVGRMSNPQKNVTGFIDVWKRFNQKFPSWKAYVLGDGEHFDIIKNYAAKKKVKNLSFEGNRKNVADYYKKAKILCMTSAYEGWGMVLVEAMAFECVPVVYDSFEAVYDVIDSGVDGIIVPHFDLDMMVRALESLASDEDFRLRMARKGIDKITKFTPERIVDDWIKKILSNS